MSALSSFIVKVAPIVAFEVAEDVADRKLDARMARLLLCRCIIDPTAVFCILRTLVGNGSNNNLPTVLKAFTIHEGNSNFDFG